MKKILRASVLGLVHCNNLLENGKAVIQVKASLHHSNYGIRNMGVRKSKGCIGEISCVPAHIASQRQHLPACQGFLAQPSQS